MFKNLKFSTIKWDNITIAGLINFFSALYFYLPIATLWYQTKGLNLAQIASLTGIMIGTIFLTNVPTGIIADKIGRKKSIMIALSLQLLGEILFLISGSYLFFIVVSIIAGLGFSFMTGAFHALIYDSLKEEGKEGQMKKVIGSIESKKGLATIIGAGASSLILSQLSPNRFALAIVMTILTVGIGLVISFFLKEPKRISVQKNKTQKQIILYAFLILKTNKSLRRIVLLAVITTPFVMYLQALYQPYFQMSHVPGPWFGLALSIGGALTFFATKYAYFIEEKLGAKIAILIFTLLPGIVYLLMAITFNPIFAVLLFCLNYGSMELQSPLFNDYMNRHIESSNRATVLSTISLITSAYIALMGPIIGTIADRSISFAFVFMGTIVIVGAFLFRINETHLVTDS